MSPEDANLATKLYTDRMKCFIEIIVVKPWIHRVSNDILFRPAAVHA